MADADRARWDAKHEAAAHASSSPSAVLVALADCLPRRGRALDLAGGRGAEAVWLAQHGLDVTLADISGVALNKAEQLASDAGVALTTVCVDLERSTPPGPWDLVTCGSYLQRSVWSTVELALGGTLVWIHPTVTNLERNTKPSARFLLQPGEGRAIIDALPEVTIVEHREAWVGNRHLSVVVAKRSVAG